MLFSEFIKQLKSCSLQALPSIYIFTGPAKQVLELKEKGLQMLAATLTGAAGDGDIIKRFDVTNFNESEFWTELYAVPFLNKTRLVVLNISERMDFIGKIDAQLKDYLAGKSLFTRLIIFIDKWEGLSVDLSRAASKKAWIIEYRPITDEDLPRWISGQLSIARKNISISGARLLTEKTGNDLDRDFDIKELTDAIIRRQPGSALKIAKQLLQKGEPVNKILGFLRTGLAYDAKYQNNNALLLSRYNKLLSADLSIKTGKLTEELALQMLIVRLAR